MLCCSLPGAAACVAASCWLLLPGCVAASAGALSVPSSSPCCSGCCCCCCHWYAFAKASCRPEMGSAVSSSKSGPCSGGSTWLGCTGSPGAPRWWLAASRFLSLSMSLTESVRGLWKARRTELDPGCTPTEGNTRTHEAAGDANPCSITCLQIILVGHSHRLLSSCRRF